MKIAKIIIALAALLALGAQSSEAQLRYGFSFGGMIADARLSGAPGCGLDNRSAFRGGFIFEYMLPNSGLGADVSLMYSRYNTRLTGTRDDGRPRSFGRNFIDIPLNFKYKFWLSGISGVAAPMIVTGPDFMIGVNDSHKGMSLKTKRLQPGWNVGLGIDIINFIELSGGYRFALGNSVDSFDGCPDARLRCNGWYVNAVMLFDF